MTYLALSAGYRGTRLPGRRRLDRAGRPRPRTLIEMSFLNLEIDLCEQILAENESKIRDYGVYDPEPLRHPDQCDTVPGGEARLVKELRRAAGMPLRPFPWSTARARCCSWAIMRRRPISAPSAGRRRGPGHAGTARGCPGLRDHPRRGQGAHARAGDVGTQITIEEFDTTSLILCTGDLAMYERIRAMVDSVSHKVVPLAIEQAEIMHRAVTETNGRLAADGHEFRSKVDLKFRRQAGIEARPRMCPTSSPNRKRPSRKPAKAGSGSTTPPPGRTPAGRCVHFGSSCTATGSRL